MSKNKPATGDKRDKAVLRLFATITCQLRYHLYATFVTTTTLSHQTFLSQLHLFLSHPLLILVPMEVESVVETVAHLCPNFTSHRSVFSKLHTLLLLVCFLTHMHLLQANVLEELTLF